MTDEERFRQDYLQQPVLEDPPLAPMLLHRERARRYDEHLANIRTAEMLAMHNHTSPQYELDRIYGRPPLDILSPMEKLSRGY